MLVYTIAMLAVHLLSAWLLRRRWVTAIALLRFEALYYVLLSAYAVLVHTRRLAFAVAILGTIHLAVWVTYEVRRPAAAPSNRTLVAVQVFDWGEAVALLWIAYILWPSAWT